MVDASRVVEIFRSRFGGEPRVFRAPGRVNLIGEHTDYNDGFVMPVAIDRDTVTAAAPRNDSMLRVYSENLQQEVSIDLAKRTQSRKGEWTSYVEGVARVLMEKGHQIGGADLVILSDVPEGAGLSSSAALELSVGVALKALNGITISEPELALAAQQAEHEYAGTQCGIMDQFISAAGLEDFALLIDCRELTYKPISIGSGGTSWVVIDTKVKHNLASSAYNERRAECAEAAKVISRKFPEVKALRDATMLMLDTVRQHLTEVVYQRARHVITENERTLKAAEALAGKRMEEMGALMFKSHYSLRDDYQVTCKELDFLVDRAVLFEGCLGSRMTGGGFGGCTISLVRSDRAEEYVECLVKDYEKEFGFAPSPLEIHSAHGAHEVVL
jgi:galactokinase